MRKSLPPTGTDWPLLQGRMKEMAAHDVDWRSGRAALYVFDPGPEVLAVQREAYGMFIAENGLGMRAFPSLKQMQDEVLDFGLSLLHAPEGAGGSMTSGGSESILLAVKTAREKAARGRGHGNIFGAEILMPFSAHPAFDKAAHMLGLTTRRIPLGADLLPDVDAMAKAITPKTFMIVGSAPGFSFGLIEPIGALGRLAQEHGLWLHVDSCIGGYLAPFVEMNGETLEPFDFRVPGVTSISADLHKFGYAAKGASTVLYRDAALLEYQIFRSSNWPSGMMETPTLQSTRAGGAIASAWAVMHFLGEAGYREKARLIIETRRHMQKGVADLGFSLCGQPPLAIFTFGADDVDPLKVGEGLYKRGWYSGRTETPRGIHLTVSPGHARIADDWLAALAEARQDALGAGASTDAVHYA